MHNIFQKTIAKELKFEGIGLHTGETARIKISPANTNEGIIFLRTDLNSNNKIVANFKNVSNAKLCTTLSNEFGVTVSTVEHLMAAFYILGIDNAVVEINKSEVPIMDGSSKDFIELLNSVGLKHQSKKRKIIKITNKFEFEYNGKTISIEPNDEGLEVDFKLNYKNKLIGNQSNRIKFYKDELEKIYSSRTFCLYEDIEKIKKNGLAKGGSLNNAIVVKDDKILNDGGLRNNKEFVNHKILDLVGDFLLSGYRILGKVKCYQGGHELTNIFLKKLLNNPNVFIKSDFQNIVISKRTKLNQSIKLAVNA